MRPGRQPLGRWSVEQKRQQSVVVGLRVRVGGGCKMLPELKKKSAGWGCEKRRERQRSVVVKSNTRGSAAPQAWQVGAALGRSLRHLWALSYRGRPAVGGGAAAGTRRHATRRGRDPVGQAGHSCHAGIPAGRPGHSGRPKPVGQRGRRSHWGRRRWSRRSLGDCRWHCSRLRLRR